MFIKCRFVTLLVEFANREADAYNLSYQHGTGMRMSVCLKEMEIKTMGKSIGWKEN